MFDYNELNEIESILERPDAGDILTAALNTLEFDVREELFGYFGLCDECAIDANDVIDMFNDTFAHDELGQTLVLFKEAIIFEDGTR